MSSLDLTLRILPKKGDPEPTRTDTDRLAYQNFEGRGRRHGADLADTDSARRELQYGITYGVAGILRRGGQASLEHVEADPDAPVSTETIEAILRDAATRPLVQPTGLADGLLRGD